MNKYIALVDKMEIEISIFMLEGKFNEALKLQKKLNSYRREYRENQKADKEK